ncbi:MAG TPA: hypothetical protein VIV60_16875, partial [Polyangiaceae bacterium]
LADSTWPTADASPPVRPQPKRIARSSGTNTTGRNGVASTPNKLGTATEQNASELATSGNLESLKAARDALKRKVVAGAATDREVRLLRALCRQLGDTTCPR